MTDLNYKNEWKALGLMSGTSLDGLDIAAVRFWKKNEQWQFSLEEARTFSYSGEWEEKLRTAQLLPAEELVELDRAYGKYLGERVRAFLYQTNFAPDFIASHGHTVFHRPEKGFTLQIGSGAAIAAETGIVTVCDFRSTDVALGGQGAPLVPIGDRLLFDDYDYCLNLGGFANISFEKGRERLAFDVCPVNIVLNELAAKFGRKYDEGGSLGRSGKIDAKLLEQLDKLPFYTQKPPKSLGREWVEREFLPILNRASWSEIDGLATVYEHIAQQLARATPGNGKMLATGGGAFNTFLLERLKAHTSSQIVVPVAQIVDFKEALVYAFLGLLRLEGFNNCLASVTGARRDNCGGAVFHP